MILIASRATHEPTTELVADWIERLGGRVLRLDAEDLWPGRHLALRTRPGADVDELRVFDPAVDRAPIDVPVGDVRVVWYRRWTLFREYLRDHDPITGTADPGGIAGFALRTAVRNELSAAGQGVLSALTRARWLSEPGTASMDKLHALREARSVGLDVPDTLLTTSRSEVRSFLDEHPAGVITKTVGPSPLAVDLPDASTIASYTAAVEPSMVAAWPETFAPSLFQERIAKRDELRVFALGDDLWAMAILSQADERTALDFRRYPGDRPNRYVPFRLDDDLADRLRQLMRSLHLDTGSIDLVRAADGRTVFLEVNPVGQFGMISQPCNYQLERRVAEHLLALHDEQQLAA